MADQHPLDSVPRVPLDTNALRHPLYDDEWHYGVHQTSAWGSTPQVTGYASPSYGDGYTAVLRAAGYTRDELPGLIAFLAHIYTVSDPSQRVQGVAS